MVYLGDLSLLGARLIIFLAFLRRLNDTKAQEARDKARNARVRNIM